MSLQDKREKKEKKCEKINIPRRTAIRISFPEMKDEVFINLLGYKEPNLVHLLRCKVSIDDDDEEEDGNDFSKFGDYDDSGRDDCNDDATRSPTLSIYLDAK